MDALLGLDVGTTSTKAVLFDLHGTEIAHASSSPYRNTMPQPGWVEQDPEEIWQAVLTAVATITQQIDQSVQVRALCMAVQSGSLLPAGAAGQPVYPLITWMDGRTQNLVSEWRTAGLEAQIKPLNGWSLYPSMCLPTIAWLRRHDPHTFAAARHYFSLNDFITFRLTGITCTNPSNGGGMQLIDIHSGQWSAEICELAGITPAQLSPIQPSGSIIGTLKPEICRAAGLSPDTVLVNGGHDQGCTALGLGVNDPGRLLLACGTAWVITGVVDSDDMRRVPAKLDWNFHPGHVYLGNGRWTISQSLGGLGASLEWWLNQAWAGINGQTSRDQMFAALDAELTQTKPGSGLFFTPLTGGHDDSSGMQCGQFWGLQLSHNRADLARAVLQSAAFELRWALEPTRQAGLPIERLWMVGGAAQSPHWPTILADVTNIPIRLPQYHNWPALGAAVLAGVGCGAFES
ncbi:MAG: hypothetical protein KDE48_04275, partial [Anaerolineales bacterium]|nr:hypothetical protein [Anaerolineales bacterium]